MSTSTSLPSDVVCTGPVPPHALFSTRRSTTSYTTPTCNSWKAITRGRLHHHPPDQVLQIESVPSPNPNSVVLFPEVGLFCIYKIPFLTLSASSMASNPSENQYSGSNFPTITKTTMPLLCFQRLHQREGVVHARKPARP